MGAIFEFFQHKWSYPKMATQLSSLKITNVVRQVKKDTHEFRRQKMCQKLDQQIGLATAHKNGELFSVKRLKNVTDKINGVTSQVEVSKSPSAWFWTDNSKTYLQLRYGTKVLPLNGTKSTIECSNLDDLVKTLLLVKSCVLGGELDAAIESASVKVRERFRK